MDERASGAAHKHLELGYVRSCTLKVLDTAWTLCFNEVEIVLDAARTVCLSEVDDSLGQSRWPKSADSMLSRSL